MPIITVKIAKGRSVTQKRELVKAITEVIVKTLDVKKEWVSVLIDEFDRENWATGGKLHLDKFGKGFGKKKTINK
ncbi:MAG: 4-oxalocrotonate tautomerase family protein [Deltaproteobacteria bacterium]|nr:4-oxalocrotonate tautomerase family protein [Deltaproteobacteria bacterium]